MNNYKGPKLRLSRRLGVPIAETPKHTLVLERRKVGFGGGGGSGKPRRRKQKSIYGMQLDEKQKLTFYYNIGNRQLRRYLELAKKNPASTADVLVELLEARLDNVLRRRAGRARSGRRGSSSPTATSWSTAARSAVPATASASTTS